MVGSRAVDLSDSYPEVGVPSSATAVTPYAPLSPPPAFIAAGISAICRATRAGQPAPAPRAPARRRRWRRCRRRARRRRRARGANDSSPPSAQLRGRIARAGLGARPRARRSRRAVDWRVGLDKRRPAGAGAVAQQPKPRVRARLDHRGRRLHPRVVEWKVEEQRRVVGRGERHAHRRADLVGGARPAPHAHLVDEPVEELAREAAAAALVEAADLHAILAEAGRAARRDGVAAPRRVPRARFDHLEHAVNVQAQRRLLRRAVPRRRQVVPRAVGDSTEPSRPCHEPSMARTCVYARPAARARDSVSRREADDVARRRRPAAR